MQFWIGTLILFEEEKYCSFMPHYHQVTGHSTTALSRSPGNKRGLPSVFIVEMGAPSLVIVEMGAPSLVIVEMGAPSLVIVEMGAPSLVIVEMGAPSLVIVEKGATSLVIVEMGAPSLVTVKMGAPYLVIVEMGAPSFVIVTTSGEKVCIHFDNDTIAFLTSRNNIRKSGCTRPVLCEESSKDSVMKKDAPMQ